MVTGMGFRGNLCEGSCGTLPQNDACEHVVQCDTSAP
jgi:hypothetical protein